MKIIEILTKRRITGNIGEKIAQKYLKKNGYKIKETNYVANGNETDIICESKDTLCFVEVKTRTLGYENLKEPRPASSVTREKQRALIGCARAYISFLYDNKKKIRFDIIEVYLNENKRAEKICHIENAFNIDTAYGGYKK